VIVLVGTLFFVTSMSGGAVRDRRMMLECLDENIVVTHDRTGDDNDTIATIVSLSIVTIVTLVPTSMIDIALGRQSSLIALLLAAFTVVKVE